MSISMIKNLGTFRMLIPQLPMWIEAEAWRLNNGGTAIVKDRQLILIHKERLSIEALNMTNGWHDPLLTISVERIAHETDEWLISNTKLLYDFENKYLSADTISVDEANELIHDLCDFYTLPLPDIELINKGFVSKCVIRSFGRYGLPMSSTLQLLQNKGRVYHRHVVHELAHYMEYLQYRVTRHGVGFCRIYAQLLGDTNLISMPRHYMKRHGLILDF